MATLPFAIEALVDDRADVEPLPRLQIEHVTAGTKRSSRFAPDPGSPNWRRPTANNFDWKRIRVGHRNEMTCTACGETTTTNYCVRCGRVTQTGEIVGAGTKLVRTLDYLHDGEYEIK